MDTKTKIPFDELTSEEISTKVSEFIAKLEKVLADKTEEFVRFRWDIEQEITFKWLEAQRLQSKPPNPAM